MSLDFVVSHYRVLDALGEGGMGQVYLALDETLKRRVALKAIQAEHRLNPATKARFLREARVLSQLDHPHICRVHDYLETPECDWIVLELIEGRTLRDAMRGSLTAHHRLAIARQIADVLVATHAAGVVHRDLKPANVMVTLSGDVKVLDFGLSAMLSASVAAPGAEPLSVSETPEAAAWALAETRLSDPSGPSARRVDVSNFQSEAGSIKGTVAYMSPEQACGELATSASDMYSYGLLLQELFGGHRPYGATADYRELLARAQRGESAPPTGMSAPLRALITELKAVAPAQRPTALDTIGRLRWIADRPRRGRRDPAVAALVLTAVAGAVRYTVDLSRERNAAVAARDEADQRRGQAESLIGFMVGDLRTKLTAVGRLEILDDVGKQALAYFASVPAGTLTDEELYRRSQALHQLGQVRQARADLPGALKAFEESLAQAEAVVRRQPDNAVWQLGLGTSHFFVGDLKRRGGDLEGALAHFTAYKAIAERLVSKDPGNFDWRLEASYGHSNLAAIYQAQRNLSAAREALRTTGALQDELAKQKPGDPTLLASRANTFNRLAIVQDALGELEDASNSFRQELHLLEQLLFVEANNMRIRRRLEVSHLYRGLLMRALGRPDEAMMHLRRAVVEAQALVAFDPTNADWQRDLAAGGMALARQELEHGPTERTRERFRQSLEILTGLASKNPTRAVAQRDLARAHVGMAEWLRGDRNVEAGARQVELAVGLLQPLVSKNPGDADIVRELAITENLRGELLASLGQPVRARQAWTHAVDLLEQIAQPSHDRNLLDPWVRALLHLGRVDDARRGYERLMSIGYRDRSLTAIWPEERAGTKAAAQRP